METDTDRQSCKTKTDKSGTETDRKKTQGRENPHGNPQFPHPFRLTFVTSFRTAWAARHLFPSARVIVSPATTSSASSAVTRLSIMLTWNVNKNKNKISHKPKGNTFGCECLNLISCAFFSLSRFWCFCFLWCCCCSCGSFELLFRIFANGVETD